MSCRAVWRWEILESKLRGWKYKQTDRKVYSLSKVPCGKARQNG